MGSLYASGMDRNWNKNSLNITLVCRNNNKSTRRIKHEQKQGKEEKIVKTKREKNEKRFISQLEEEWDPLGTEAAQIYCLYFLSMGSGSSCYARRSSPRSIELLLARVGSVIRRTYSSQHSVHGGKESWAALTAIRNPVLSLSCVSLGVCCSIRPCWPRLFSDSFWRTRH